MAVKIHCFLSPNGAFQEIEKVSQSSDKIKINYLTTEEELIAALPPPRDPQLLLFDPMTLSLASSQTMQLFNDEFNYILALISAEDENDENIKFFHMSPEIGHLIPAKNKSITDEMNKLLMIVNAAEVVDGLELTVDKVLNSLKNKKTFELTESQERWQCYEEIAKYTDNLHVFPEFSNIVRTAASLNGDGKNADAACDSWCSAKITWPS